MSLQLVESGFVDKDHSGTVTAGDQVNFTATAANNGGVPLVNVHVFDNFNPTGTTCATLAAGARCISTSSHIVTAGDVAAGQVVDQATASANGLPTQNTGGGSSTTNQNVLTVISGNDQVVPVGGRSTPLIVQLTNNGTPVAGAVVAWTVSGNATLVHATSTTGPNGEATNDAILHQAGAVTITARSPAFAAGPVIFTLNGGIADLSGLTPGEIQVAGALDNACPALARKATLTPAQQDLLAQCAAISSAASNPAFAGTVLSQLAPEDALLQTSASVLVTTAQFDNVKARLAALRSGTGGDHFGGLAFATPDGMLPAGGLVDTLLGYDAANGDQKKQEAGSGFDRWGFFASGTFSHGAADPRSATPGYGFHTDGFTAGVDYRYSDQFIFGLSAGYNNYSSDVDFVGGGLNTHGWTLSAYSTFFRQDNWYLDQVLSYGSNSYDINRRIMYTIGNDVVNQTAMSDSSGHTFAGSLTLGRDFSNGPWSYGPYLREEGSRTDFGGYQENLIAGQPGSGLGLAVQERRAVSLEGVLGGKVNYAASTSWGVLMPHAELEWVHEFRDNPDSINASFLQDPTATPFLLRGNAVDPDFFKLGVGMSAVFSHGRSGFFYVERILGQSGVSQADVAIGFRMEF